MSSANRTEHWNGVYGARTETEVSWFQETPEPSLDLLRLIGASSGDAIIDIGGGASRLVDHLLNEGFENVTVLDLSETALTTARNRLGERGSKVKWITSDVTTWEPGELYEIWHDRAALHFLTEAADQASYVKRLKKALRIDGHAIIGTFALDGPEKCSGLPVVRHDANSLSALLGPEFVLIDTRRHEHTTPSLSVQKFLFSTYHRQA